MTNYLPSDERVDRLLGDYFKAQLPAHWPPAPWPAAPGPAAARTPHSAARSRWALAASVAVLIGGCWYLSGSLDHGKNRNGVSLEGGTAKMPSLPDKPKPDPKVGMP